MDRRQLLGAVGTGLSVGLAGCGLLNGGNGADTDSNIDSVSLGKTHTHDGVAVTVAESRTVSEYYTYPVMGYRHDRNSEETNDEYYENASDSRFSTPDTAGGIFVLARVVVEHVGETRKQFPGTDNMAFLYNGEVTKTYTPNASIRVGETNYLSYSAVADEESPHTNGAYPGYELDAWVVFEAPVKFDREAAEIRIQWGSADGGETFAWSLSE